LTWWGGLLHQRMETKQSTKHPAQTPKVVRHDLMQQQKLTSPECQQQKLTSPDRKRSNITCQDISYSEYLHSPWFPRAQTLQPIISICSVVSTLPCRILCLLPCKPNVMSILFLRNWNFNSILKLVRFLMPRSIVCQAGPFVNEMLARYYSNLLHLI
jgi:hypothetical protein